MHKPHMIAVEEALEKVLATVRMLEAEEKPILGCRGQVLDEDINAGLDIPPHDNAAMDGFAVIASDTAGSTFGRPRVLTVAGEIAAGYISTVAVSPGSALRIMTGAPVPEGANAVVQFENTDEAQRKKAGVELREIGIFVPAATGLNIRRKGEDVSKGAAVLAKGTILKPAHIGLLASLGRTHVRVIRRPVVSVLATGDELCHLGQPLSPGQIYDSNTYTVAANVEACGGRAHIAGIGKDTIESLRGKIATGMESDMLITSGGVSRGDYDVVKDVLAEMGQVGFWTVRMKPGKPLAFGTLNRPDGRAIPHLGLPGNPVSSMITFEQFARPAILKMQGRTNYQRPVVEAAIDGEIVNDDGRRVYARVRLIKRENAWLASLTGAQGSGILSSMAAANGLAIVPEDCEVVHAGDMVQVLVLDDTGDN